MQPIAYFSAEYAFDNLPIFAGGLGVLATDYLRSVQATDVPLVAVGLFYHYGFANVNAQNPQKLQPADDGWEMVEADGKPLRLQLRLDGQDVTCGSWSKQFDNVTVYLITCDIEENTESQRHLTAHLYDKDSTTKVLQDALLGIGGVELLRTLEIEPQLYHLNEGHTALAILARLAVHKQARPHATPRELCEAVTQETVASKHTVLSAAGLYIHLSDFHRIFDGYLKQHDLDPQEVFELGRDSVRRDDFTTTRLMLSVSRSTNAVSKLHAVSEKKLHPDSPFDLISITNGVHLPRWQRPDITAAMDTGTLWQLHEQSRVELIQFVNAETGSQLDPSVLTMVWARRITGYKRPLELFEDIDRLRTIVTDPKQPLQIIIAGKPNVEDEVGVEMARQIGEHALNPVFNGRIAYLSQYNLDVAHKLVAGADIWLNTPEKGYEASGTSGMKAGSNGVLQCTVSDGWADEADLGDIGWILPDMNVADCLYGYLQHEMAPLFYDRGEDGLPEAWLQRMQVTIKLIETGFSAARMRDEYFARVYQIRT